MAGDYAALGAELAKPDLSGASAAAAAAKLNADLVVELVPGSYLMQAGVLQVLGLAAGVAAMEKLKAAAQADTGLGYVLEILQGKGTSVGIDFGDGQVRAMVGQLEQIGVLTPADAAALLGYGQRARSRAESIAGWGLPVTPADVAKARSL